MVASRAINGLRADDALAAVCVADTAMYKAEQIDDPDLSAQAFLWAGIANFYDGQSEKAQGYLDKADALKNHLKSDTDRTVLALWIKHEAGNKSVEKRKDGYSKRFRLGKRRTSSAGTASTIGSQKHNLHRIKATNKMNDLPEFDSGMSIQHMMMTNTDKRQMGRS